MKKMTKLEMTKKIRKNKCYCDSESKLRDIGYFKKIWQDTLISMYFNIESYSKDDVVEILARLLEDIKSLPSNGEDDEE